MYKKYRIDVHYSTGDSGGTYDVDSNLGMEWNNLNIAKINLNRLKQHWEWYESKNDIDQKTLPKPEFVSDKWNHVFTIISDDMNEMQVSASWTGHFETLYKAEIVENIDPELFFQPHPNTKF